MDFKFQQIFDAAKTIIIEQDEVLMMSLACLLGGGHLLIEDLPGVGKTTMVLVLSKLLNLDTKRVQFTVDTLPSDILGSNVYNQKNGEFNFYKGPIFTQIFLADELNRASPRTQGALLQSMEEGYVSIEGQDHQLPKPFLVIATQNPMIQSGTFPLPESQLDRFSMALEMNFISHKAEVHLFLSELDSREKLSRLKHQINSNDLLEWMQQVQKIHVSSPVANYVASLLEKSRQVEWGQLPLSTRCGISIIKNAKSYAFIQNRNFVLPEDIQTVLIPSIRHRLGGNQGIIQGKKWAEQLLNETKVA